MAKKILKKATTKPVMRIGATVKKSPKKYGNGGEKDKPKDPPKNGEKGTKNPDYLKGERGAGPYSMNTQVNSLRTSQDSLYKPKIGRIYVNPGELSKQDSLDINANRNPTFKQIKTVAEAMKKGESFPGLSKEFMKGIDSYNKLPDKYKKKGGPVSTSLNKVQAYYKNKKK